MGCCMNVSRKLDPKSQQRALKTSSTLELLMKYFPSKISIGLFQSQLFEFNGRQKVGTDMNLTQPMAKRLKLSIGSHV